jgi:murein DD-endopeptidase MepM/ murein hydrolase activator NlpD
MRRATALLTRVLGIVLVVVLGTATTCGSAAALGTSGDPAPEGVWPLHPRPAVVTAFRPPDSPWGPGHRGVDLLGVPDARVRAALPGVVGFAGPLAGRGVVVVVHGDTRTTYEPVTPSVTVGERVAAGAVVGRLALPGGHCPPRACLHWGWLSGDTYLDPLLLVGAGPVRLLPLWRPDPASAPASVLTSRAPAERPRSPYAGWRPPLQRLGFAP